MFSAGVVVPPGATAEMGWCDGQRPQRHAIFGSRQGDRSARGWRPRPCTAPSQTGLTDHACSRPGMARRAGAMIAARAHVINPPPQLRKA